MKKFSYLMACLVAAFSVSTASADFVWTEVGDAGSTNGTAQYTTGSGSLLSLTGSVSAVGDADVYVFSIGNTATFSATATGTIDTQLFLMSFPGNGIAFNDDAPFPVSILPAGNSLYATLPAGNYLLGISHYDNDPINGLGELFPDTFTGVHGPTGPGGGFPYTSFSGGGGGAGTYSIAFTAAGASTPAPAALWMGLAGAGVLGALRRRFRKA